MSPTSLFFRLSHPDYLGSIEWVTNADGRPVEYFWYSPWGETLHDDNTWRGRFRSPFKFTGHVEDEETGLTYAGARYYPARVGKWLSVDRLAHKYPSWSPYNYVLNNPVNLIDPNGDSVLTSQEGFNILNEGLNASLNNQSPFSYDAETGAMAVGEFDRSQFSGEQLDLIDRYTTLIESETDIVNVSIVDFDENISEINQSLKDRGASGITVPYDINNAETGERVGTEQNVYIARNPQQRAGNDPLGNPRYRSERPYYRGLTGIHEVGGHAYLNVTQPNMSRTDHNRAVENFEQGVRGFYMYQGRPIRGHARRH